jgi:hypothetical protein
MCQIEVYITQYVCARAESRVIKADNSRIARPQPTETRKDRMHSLQDTEAEGASDLLNSISANVLTHSSLV